MATPPAHVVGAEEGMQAKKEGKPRINPYADKSGPPDPSLARVLRGLVQRV